MSKCKLLKIQKNKEKIVQLLNQNIDLNYEINLNFFRKTYSETRNIGTEKSPKFKDVKIGCWFDTYTDESNSNYPVKIERFQIIEVDGKRSDGWQPLKYYTIDSI